MVQPANYPPFQHPIQDPKTGLVTRPWTLWFLQQSWVSPQYLVMYGTRIQQPAATTVAAGTLYGVSDEGVIERSNGRVWQPFGPL